MVPLGRELRCAQLQSSQGQRVQRSEQSSARQLLQQCQLWKRRHEAHRQRRAQQHTPPFTAEGEPTDTPRHGAETLRRLALLPLCTLQHKRVVAGNWAEPQRLLQLRLARG